MAIVTGNISTSSMTHTGSVRDKNEDALMAIPQAGIWAVADGMGGHEEGDFASHCVISHLYEAAMTSHGRTLVQRIPEALQAANRELFLRALAGHAERIIGTTIVVLVLETDRYHCFWCGDSRCYLFRDRLLTPITRDHTEAEAMRAEGIYSDADILANRSAQALTYAIGVDEEAQLDYVSDYIYEDDRFLLCSDGITKVYSHLQLTQRVAAANIDSINQEFLVGALAAGAPDNLSSIIVSL